MSRLADIAAALERGPVLVEAPDLHPWPEITGLTADSRTVTAGVLYCAVTGSGQDGHRLVAEDRKSTRLNSSHSQNSYAVFCFKKKKPVFRRRRPHAPD